MVPNGEEMTPEEEKKADEIFNYIAAEIGKGREHEQIIKQLMLKGLSKSTSTQLVKNVRKSINEFKNSKEGRHLMASKFKRKMLFGILWIIGGVTLTYFSEHFIFYGAIIYGIIEIYRGYTGWEKYSS